MHVYGKTPEQLADMIAAFGLVLGDFNIDDVTDSFKEHLKRSNKMPTPADIVKLVEKRIIVRKHEVYRTMKLEDIMKSEYPQYKEDSVMYRVVADGVRRHM